MGGLIGRAHVIRVDVWKLPPDTYPEGSSSKSLTDLYERGGVTHPFSLVRLACPCTMLSQFWDLCVIELGLPKVERKCS